MQCRDVEAAVEQEGLEPLPGAARAHVAGCRNCQGFVADLQAIVSAAERLPAEIEPPARVWLSLRNQLELEGIIKEPVTAPPAPATEEEQSSWWQGWGNLVRTRAFAVVTVGLLIAAAGALQLRQPQNPPMGDSSSWRLPFEKTAKVLNEQEVDLRNMHLSSTSPVDASLEQNLQQVDAFIADCERHLKEVPQDDLAREYLSDAYQQKAELLSAMMDRGRSVN
jgi:hypothetical protein